MLKLYLFANDISAKAKCAKAKFANAACAKPTFAKAKFAEAEFAKAKLAKAKLVRATSSNAKFMILNRLLKINVSEGGAPLAGNVPRGGLTPNVGP